MMHAQIDSFAVLDGLAEPLVVLSRAGRLLFANAQFRRASGWLDRSPANTMFVEAWPSMFRIMDHACYLHALTSGQPVQFEYTVPSSGLRYEIRVHPIAFENVSILFREMSHVPVAPTFQLPALDHLKEHPYATLHAKMLADMGACLRADLGAAETFFQVASILGRLPDVERATFGTVDVRAKTITIHQDYCRGLPSMAGVYPMSETEITCQELARGQVVVITDVRTDYRSRDAAELRFKRGYLACVAIPMMRDGEWAATLMVQSCIPRVWLPDEVELIRTAAERTWLAVENARLLQEARQANAAKDRFLAMLSHELRTPLTPVVMMLTALQNSEAIPPEEKSDLAMIRRNIELETRLIDDLLDITRITNGKLRLKQRPVRVHELLAHVCQICKSDASLADIELSCDIQATRDCVNADPARLEQIFWNLIKNAIKFTPPGGRVRITTSDGDGEILLDVRDTGAGIPQDMLSRIFNAFEQGEQMTRNAGGLGLGLAISKAIVDLHGGRIRAHSDGANRGSTFQVALPLRVAEIHEEGVDQAGDPHCCDEPRSRMLRVLLVDDHADTMRIMQRMLAKWGMQVTGASKVREAIRMAEEIKFDLIISDIGLPDGSGCELLAQIRKSQPTPAIALSGFGMEADVKRSLEAGFAAHLTKPVNLEHLQQVIAELMREEGSTLATASN
jgi:signal transduction histidine kinase/CheY-like chemotaxis protein